VIDAPFAAHAISGGEKPVFFPAGGWDILILVGTRVVPGCPPMPIAVFFMSFPISPVGAGPCAQRRRDVNHTNCVGTGDSSQARSPNCVGTRHVASALFGIRKHASEMIIVPDMLRTARLIISRMIQAKTFNFAVLTRSV
jgi:hypothetical protein